MRVVRLHYKNLKFEMESAGVLFTIAMAFITGGIAMLTENVWIYLLNVAAEVLLKKEKSYSNEIIGPGLLIIGLVFLFVTFRNWRVKIYSDLHERVRAVVHAYYTTLHMRERSFNRNLWEEQHTQVHRQYAEATEYIDKNKIKI